MNHAATVLLIGGSGFLGRYISDRLLKNKHPVIILSRKSSSTHHDEIDWRTNASLSQDNLTSVFSTLPEDSVIINLVGQLHDAEGIPYGPGFREAHVALPKRIIEAMNHAHLTRFIHISSLGADSQGASMYQRSKGDGEKLIQKTQLNWTIFRPSVIFGRDDAFIKLFAKLCRFFPIIPLAMSESRFQPVSVDDVALAVVKSLTQANTYQRSIDLGGPHIYSLKEIVQFAGKTINKEPVVIPLPKWVGTLQAFVLEHLPGKTLMSRDNLASMSVDNILPDAHQPLTELFNISPTPLETLLP